MSWSARDICEVARSALARADAEAQEAQSVRGIDALSEVQIHPMLERGFRESGLGAHREGTYAGQVESRPIHRERERCDFVLTHDPEARLLDPVSELVEIDRASGTLFETVAESMSPEGPVVEPGAAYWLEVKVVAQVAYVGGVPQPNASYASQLVAGPRADIVKIAREPTIEHGGAMVVLFTRDRETAEADLRTMFHKLLDQDLPICETVWETFEIEDRAGNGVCAVALAGVRL